MTLHVVNGDPLREVTVWKDHQLLKTYPPGTGWELDDEAEELTIVLPARGAQWKDRPRGDTWHPDTDEYDALGVGVLCGFREADPNCSNCHPEP